MERNSRIIVAVAICALVFMCFFVEQTAVMAEEAFGYTTTKHQKWSTSSLSWKGLQSNGAGLSTTDHEETNPTRRKLNQFLPDPSSFGNFISWQSLLADQIPCPAGTGRSYYTPNCDLATGPVVPYYRGCSAITLCARGVWSRISKITHNIKHCTSQVLTTGLFQLSRPHLQKFSMFKNS